MKKLLFLLSLIITIQFSFSQEINYDEAKQIAVDFFETTETDTTLLKSGSLPDVDTFKTFYIKDEGPLKSAGNEQIPAFYIMNRSDKPGFVIISGDERVRKIIASSNSKNINFINPGLRILLDQYLSEINYIKSSDLSIKPNNYDYSQIQYDAGDNLLGNIEWGQSVSPYNTLCPLGENDDGVLVKCPAGCVATAMAQIIYYYRYPRHGIGSYSYNSDYRTESADFENTEYMYEYMEDFPFGTTNSHISTLLYHCGVSVKMDYEPDGSSASLSNPLKKDADEAFPDHFGYKECDFKNKTVLISWSNWGDIIKNEIDNKRPVLYAAEDPNNLLNPNDLKGAHAFVIDGYKNDDTYYVNWGWDGVENGWYALTLLNPTVYNEKIGGYDDFDFKWNHRMIVGIEPANPDLIPPTVSITSPSNDATVSGNVTVLADASDDGGIAKVVFYIDNTILCEDNIAPYSCNWNTESYSNDYYLIKAKAYDNTNNTSENYIGVIVDNTPPEEPHLGLITTNIPNPVPYSGGSYTIQVENTGTGTLNWNTQDVPSWVHLSSSSGSVSVSQNISVTVDPTTIVRNAQIKFYNTGNSSNYAYLQINQSAPPAATADWEMFQKNYSHFGYQNTTLNTDVGIEWMVNSSTNISTYRGPIIVDNKIIIAGTDAINCYGMDGSLLWTKSNFYANTHPAVYNDVLFVTNDDSDGDGKLYAIDISDGRTIASSAEHAPFEGVITVDASGIYIPGEQVYIYAFTFNGSSISLKWYFQSYTQFGEFLEYRDGGVALDGSYVYFNGVDFNDQYLYGVKLNKTTGNYVDHFMITDAASDIDRCNTPVIYNDLIYFSYDVGINGMLDCRYPSTLNLKWNYSSFSDYRITPPVAYGSNIYVGDDDGYAYGFNASSGSLLFAEDDGSSIEKGMAVTNNCLVALRDNELDLLNLSNGTEIIEVDLNSSHYSPPAVVGNKIIAFNQDEEIYCISDVFPPEAYFTASPTSGYSPLNVNFTDGSDAGSCSITGWFWDFGDNSTSTLKSPSHIYTDPGTYTVSLTVSSSCGSDTYTRSNYISVNSSPILSFIPTEHTFPDELVGNCSDNYTFLLKNTGGGTATGNLTLSNNADFEIVSGGGGFSLTSAATHEVVVRYCPSSDGPKADVLNTNADSPSNSPTANLYGTGIAPYITLSNPNGGDTWMKGNTYDILWNDNISENVKIELYKNGTLEREIEPSIPSNGNYPWQVPGDLVTASDYKIRVTSTVNTSLWDESNASFSITDPYDPATLTISEVSGAVGSIVCVPVNATDMTDITGFQFTINYDPTKLAFVSCSNWPAAMSPPTVSNPEAGVITVVYADPNSPFSIVDGKFFEICFEILEGAEGTTSIIWSDSPTERLIVNSDLAEIPGSYTEGSVTIMQGFSLSGLLTYNNSGLTPLSDVPIDLVNESQQIIDGDITVADGSYLFPGLQNGNYGLSPAVNLPWGGVSVLDILKIKMYIGDVSVSPFYEWACDVNEDGSINVVDVLMLIYKLGDPDNYVLINGDWAYNPTSATINNTNLTQDILALCYGDVDGSYDLSGISSKSATEIFVQDNGEIELLNNGEFIVPFRIDQSVDQLAAVGLTFNYPEELFEVNDVSMVSANEDLYYTVIDGTIRIVFATLKSFDIQQDDQLFSIRFAPRNEIIRNYTFEKELSFSGQGILVDISAKEVNNVHLVYSKLSGETLTSIIQNGESEIMIYPNPAKDEVKITNAENSLLTIYDLLGQKIKTVNCNSSLYTVDIREFVTGVYVFDIEKDNTKYVKRISVIK